VIKLLYHIVSIAHNTPIFGCVGTVQGNRVESQQIGLLEVPWALGAGVRRPFFRR